MYFLEIVGYGNLNYDNETYIAECARFPGIPLTINQFKFVITKWSQVVKHH